MAVFVCKGGYENRMQIKVMHREQCFAAAGGYGQEYNTENITIPTMIISKDGACYGYWSWLDVRPIPTSLEAKYAQKDSPLFRMSFSNRSIESLLHMYYYFGVDMEPDYQRGSVWNDEDRVKLLDSIFAGREIGRFVFREVPYEESLEKKCMYEVVDGKQRLMTLCAFYENRFPYRGCFYNELPAEDKNWFGSAMTSLASLSDKVTKKEVLEVFVALNQNGRPIEEAVLNHAKKLLDDIR